MRVPGQQQVHVGRQHRPQARFMHQRDQRLAGLRASGGGPQALHRPPAQDQIIAANNLDRANINKITGQQLEAETAHHPADPVGIVVIARHAPDAERGFQPGERLQRIVHPHRRIPDLAGVEIAGDHHQIGMQRVDLIHDAVQPHLRHIPVAAVQIGKMHQPQRPLQPGQFDAIMHHRRIADRAEPARPTKGKHQAGKKEREPFQSRALFSLSSARKALNGLSFSATPPAATRRSC